MQTCRKCGAFLMEGWDRCKICGSDLPETPAPPGGPAPPGRPPPAGAADSPDSRPPARGWLAPAAIAAVVVVLLGAAYIIVVRPEDDEPATRQAYLDALVFGAEDEAAEFGIAADWDCIAEATIDALGGPEGLHERGITPEDLAEEDGLEGQEAPPGAAQEVAAALPTCGLDSRALLGVALAEAGDPNITPELARCVTGAVDPAIADVGLAASLIGDPADEPETIAFEEHLEAVTTMCLA